MLRNQAWLNLPQAVILTETRDLALALSLVDADSNRLLLKASRILAVRVASPPEAAATDEQRGDVYKRLQQQRLQYSQGSRYLVAQQGVQGLLAAGVTVKASRKPGGPLEVVDPAEFTRVELRGVDAIDKRSGEVVLFDLRIDAFEFIEKLREPAADAVGGSSNERQLSQQASAPKWTTKGNPVRSLIEWARSRWGDDLDKLPNSQELLWAHRQEFLRVRGLNEKTMRAVRRSAIMAAHQGNCPELR
jgi:hypothetical protein